MNARTQQRTEVANSVPFDERLFSRPERFAAIIVGVIVLILTILVLAILGYSVIPEISAHDLVTDALSALLALGTLSLAYATGYMAQSVRRQAESAEKMRQDQMRPHLSIVLMESSRPERPTIPPAAVMSTPILTPVSGLTNLTFAVRNLGPGNAMGVHVECPVWEVVGDGPWTGTESIVLRHEDLEPSKYVPIENRSLKANEERSFDLPVAMPLPPDTGNKDGTYRLTGQIEVHATCNDVEGRPAELSSFYLQLQQIIPVRVSTTSDILGGNEPTGHGYELLWAELPHRKAGPG